MNMKNQNPYYAWETDTRPDDRETFTHPDPYYAVDENAFEWCGNCGRPIGECECEWWERH